MSLDRAPVITTPIESHELHLTRTVTSHPSSESIRDPKKLAHGLGSLTHSSIGLGIAVNDTSVFDPEPAVRTGRRLSVWHKIDLCVLPIVTAIFFLAFLDKSNISNARVAGLQTQLKLTDYQYTVALTVTYIPYILVELPSNLWLKRIGPHRLLPAMATLWGLASALQGVVSSYTGLIVCRFFVGLFEGGLLPGLALYLSGFYPKHMLQSRISAFFVSTSLAGAFSGLLASAIERMDGVGGRSGWAWIFILEGTFTIAFGLLACCLLPRGPLHVPSWALDDDERAYVRRVLLDEGLLDPDAETENASPASLKHAPAPATTAPTTIDWRTVRQTLTRRHVPLLALAGFFNGATLSGLAYFLPSIVASLLASSSSSSSPTHTQLLSVPPFAAAFAFSMVLALGADRLHRRGGREGAVCVCAGLVVCGFALFLGAGVGEEGMGMRERERVKYGALFLLVCGTYGAAPPLATMVATYPFENAGEQRDDGATAGGQQAYGAARSLSREDVDACPALPSREDDTSRASAHHTYRATALAVLCVATNAGGVLSTWLLGWVSPGPGYTAAGWVFLAFGVGMGGCVGVVWGVGRRGRGRRG